MADKHFSTMCAAMFLAATIALATTPYDRLVERLKQARSIECRAVTSSGERIRILAARGGKIRMESPQRTVVSNGSTVWNYVPSRKTVTVSSFVAGTAATFDRIAFELIEQYRPETKSTEHVVLRPAAEMLYGVRSIVLEFADRTLRAITVEHTTGTERWTLRSVRYNPPTPSDAFEFTVPVGVEVIDMR
ncbi:MAG: outer-membrane lipoprotein carrier protein LolA [Chlorobi bacterium]|nr:outer-membrane lipoprotein carrier protein LolA [Chlorobiota bacterium]